MLLNYRPRHMEARLLQVLPKSRIVALTGPRQSGKSTLAMHVAQTCNMHYSSMDAFEDRDYATHNPEGYLNSHSTLVIDEIQRVPHLMLALKKRVDENPQRGRYLITGSVDILRSTRSMDSLAGRVRCLELLPFSQGEIQGQPPHAFLQRAFAASFPSTPQPIPACEDLLQRIIYGGYPESLLCEDNDLDRQDWFMGYIQLLLQKDAQDLAGLHKPSELRRLLQQLAFTREINKAQLARDLHLSQNTIERWLCILEELFLIRRVPAWHHRHLKRLIKRPRLQFLDPGLLSAMQHLNVARLSKQRSLLGNLLECFVFSEISKAINTSHSHKPCTIHYFRNKDGCEVDFILQSPHSIVGIEVKAASTVVFQDFQALRTLQQTVKDDWACGIVLYTGTTLRSMGERLFAVPIQTLWAG